MEVFDFLLILQVLSVIIFIMKKAIPQKSVQKSKPAKVKFKPAYYILLFAYLLAAAYTPNFYTLDTNAPKFLAIAILNLVSMVVFLYDPDFKRSGGVGSGFFRNFIGLAYTLFLILSLISFFQAFNLSESVINFSKIFTVFASTYVLYVIFSSNRRYLFHVAVGLALMLVFDSFSVFYEILNYISGKINSIYEIKSVYSNKNILAAAIFVKLPIALWLMAFAKRWFRLLGYFAAFCAILAVLFTSTRAFYIGNVLLFVTFGVFSAVQYFIVKNKFLLYNLVAYFGVLLAAIAIYSFTQNALFPKNNDTYNKGIASRLATVSDKFTPDARLTIWKRSFRLIKEHPLEGVGSGNWKIQVLKYESPESENFIISYKNHNDFIEVTAETGLFGGLAYLSVFILILVNFLRKALNRKTDQEMIKYFFLPAFGILAYSVDAFFNFPNDRPEIQAIFALYVSMGIAFSDAGDIGNAGIGTNSPLWKKISGFIPFQLAVAVSFLLMGASVFILSMNVKSLHFQRYVYEDQQANIYTHPSSFFIAGFPPIPNLSCDGAPINSYIARYLINENRYEEAIKYLINDKTTPYDSRREYYLSMVYDKMGITDSLIYYGKKACALKPLHANMVMVLSSRLFNTGKHLEGIKTVETYLKRRKTNRDAWLLAANQNMLMKNEAGALQLLDSAMKYLPNDSSIINQWKPLHYAFYIKPYSTLYEQSNQEFSAKRYPEALKLLDDFIAKKPEMTEAYQNRALCLYFMGEYAKSLLDVEKAISRGDGNENFLLNLRGIDNISLGRKEAACEDFKKAMEKGNADAIANFKRYCR